MDITEAFNKCIKFSSKDGRYLADCKLGLWGVNAATEEDMLREATTYFLLYFQDLEYEELLWPDGKTKEQLIKERILKLREVLS